MDIHNLIESLLRWAHVVFGILWVGHLYFFNFVNATFVPTMDAETKKKVLPQLMPRALYFFKMGAAFTWVTGITLLMLVYYHTKLHLDLSEGRKPGSGIMILVVFLGFAIYDKVFKAVANPVAQLVLALVLTVAVVLGLSFTGFSYRGAAIHLGALFGTIMAANVFMRIGPAQRKILAALKASEAPDAEQAALSAARSRHNTYLSVPLVFTMLAQHGTWAASYVVMLPLVVLLGWLLVFWLYRKAASVVAG